MLGEAGGFGVEEGFDGPLDYGGEGGVVGAGGGGERVAGNLIWEEGVAGGEGAERGAGAGEAGEVSGQGGAVAADEGGLHLSFFLEREREEVEVLAGEPGLEGEFYLGCGEKTDFLAGEVCGTGDVGGEGDEEAYAVVEERRAEGEGGVGGVGEVERLRGDEVDPVGAEGGGGGDVVGVGGEGGAGAGAEDSDGYGTTDIGVEGDAGAVIVGGGVFGDFVVDAAAEGFGLADAG